MKLYIWRTQDDGKVRSSHVEYSDRIFSWDTPPEEGHPGHSHNCRCWAEPYEHDYRKFYIETVLIHEGGYVDDPDDSGGATKYGVTIGTWKIWSQKLFGIAASKKTLKELTEEQAFEIFKHGYWMPSGADRIADPHLAYMHADFAYLSGQRNAIRELQRATNAQGVGIAQDGIFGIATLRAVNASNIPLLYRTYRANRWAFLEQLMASRPKDKKHRNGWRNRVFSFDAY